MEITILIDRDLEGLDVFLVAGLRETIWNELLRIQFKRLRDYGLPDNCPDQEIWRFVQQHSLLLLTNNRNADGATSLQATVEREGTASSLPVITVSNKESLALPDYRQRVMHSLAEIILYPEKYRGTGRLFVP